MNDGLSLTAYMKVTLTKAKPKEETNESTDTSGKNKQKKNQKTKADGAAITLDPFLWNPIKQEEREENHEEIINYVTARFKDMSGDGIAKIQFNTDMFDQTKGFHLSMINETILDVRLSLSSETIESSSLKPEQLANLTWVPKLYAY